MAALSRVGLVSVFLLGCISVPISSMAAEPLDVAARIDKHLARYWQEQEITPAAPASETEFVRRVYLDLIGRIPSVSEVRRYLADHSSGKQARLVEKLLERPDYINNFTNKWENILIPEAADNRQLQYRLLAFRYWLQTKFANNTPYDQWVRELLTLPATQPNQNRGRQRQQAMYANNNQASPLLFYQSKAYSPENMGAATARMFLGIRLECAQCHDHPFDEWKQNQFWSFAAFYAGMKPSNPRNATFGFFTEDLNQTELKIPDKQESVPARFLNKMDVAPQMTPGSSPREALADWITAPENPYFAKALVNRMWDHFLGYGIVDPVDDFGPANPVSHPELLDMLAEEFTNSRFDFKFLIKAITSSQAYQLSSVLSHASQNQLQAFARMPIRGMTQKQLLASLSQATGIMQPANSQISIPAATAQNSASEIGELFASGSTSRTEARITILQALALMNGRYISDATSLQNSHTLAAVLDYPHMDTSQKIETLFLATVSRPPHKSELEKLVAYVESGGARNNEKQAFTDVFWMLLNSSEFLFQH